MPWLFVAGFLVVVLANGAMIYAAVGSFSGLETEHAYETGVAYNRVLAEARAQRQRGWNVDLAVTQPGGAGHHIAVAATFTDSSGRSIDGLAAHAVLRRPTRSGYDVDLPLVADRAGTYRAEADLPFVGEWEIDLTAEGSSGAWRSHRRIHLR